MSSHERILTINAGSSSIKIALFGEGKLHPILTGKVERIGSKNASFTLITDNKTSEVAFDASNFHTASLSLVTWLDKQPWFHKVEAIGHRIVHGMNHRSAEVITDRLLRELSEISNYDPDHLPAEIEIIRMLRTKNPALIQVACFDTSFHTTIPGFAKTFAIPKKYYEQGIQRYGFHGISYSYLMEELSKDNEEEATGKIILAHLGSGASLTAVKNGNSVDTSMGFTPAGGIAMSTRSGDLDPGVAWYLMQQGMDANAFNNLINHESGLLGVSGISGDIQELLQQESENEDAALAIAIFCYQIKKQIGAYLAALAGLDILVFSGGIGEHSATIRSRICSDLEFAGIELNEEKNNKNNRLISTQQSAVKIYVIPTNEEVMIKKLVKQILKK